MPNNFPPQLIASELYNCCCQKLQNNLQNVGLQVESTERDIIDMIKENAVQTTNELMHMREFFGMDQEEKKKLTPEQGPTKSSCRNRRGNRETRGSHR